MFFTLGPMPDRVVRGHGPAKETLREDAKVRKAIAEAQSEKKAAEAKDEKKGTVAAGAAYTADDGPLDQRPGVTPEPQLVGGYYLATRGSAGFYAYVSASAPLAIGGAALWLAWMVTGAEPSWTSPADWLTWIIPTDYPPAGAHALADQGGRLHFVAALLVLAAVSAAATVFGLTSATRVFQVHKDKSIDFGGALVIWILIGGLFLLAMNALFGEIIGRLMEPVMIGFGSTKTAWGAHSASAALIIFGVGFAAMALLAVGAAVFALAWRFETDFVNGVWSDSYVLREKLNTLMGLVFVSAVLLVAINLFLASISDWSLDLALHMDAPLPEELANSVKAYSSKMGNFIGAVSTLMMIAMFLPCFLVLLDDIDIAGRTHAVYDMRGEDTSYKVQKPRPEDSRLFADIAVDSERSDASFPLKVAGWKLIGEWKAKHGLTLSFTDLLANFAAIGAPLLANGAIDISKLALGGH